ncbi:urease accessory protein UreE [uncultured Bosea sp.]|uniref:urease accessory protein UreE n=1 Tax=uncultured Bosea sp. TaxID=211457 RepID=UPI0025E8B63B|nr:urease accessory protein UreE [uncultured Bosea sp.]
MLKAIAVKRATDAPTSPEPVLGRAVLQHDERHLRRRMIETDDGRKILVDLPETVVLAAGDALAIEGGGIIAIAAADEPLYAIRGRDPLHLTELAWHIGNRHLAAAIAADRILILRDHVIKAMLHGLDAEVEEIVAAFNPVRGAYSGHGHSHAQGDGDHHHSHDHHHDHGHDHHHDHGHHTHSHAHGKHHHHHD